MMRGSPERFHLTQTCIDSVASERILSDQRLGDRRRTTLGVDFAD